MRRYTRHVLVVTIALLFALPLLGLVTGCSAGAIRQQSHVAESMDDAATQARAEVLGARADELRDAGQRAMAEGRDVRAELVLAAEAFDAGPAVSAYNVFVNFKIAYTRALLLALQDRRPSFATLLPIAADAARAWASLRAALGRRGERLPEVPAFITGGAR